MWMARSRSQEIADAIRDDIVAGTLRPGERLPEVRLAEDYEVSRIPVREALQRLESEGFVRITPNRGAVVGHVSPTDAIDLLEVRAAIEVLVVQRAAERRTDEQVAELRDLAHRGLAAALDGNFDELPALNVAYHELIARVADNAIAGDLMERLRHKIEWVYSVDLRNRAAESWQEHVELADAIATGDRRLAGRLMRQHIDHADEAYRRRVEHLEAEAESLVTSR
jgi:DNA-binding GntR family transcriptional regulator